MTKSINESKLRYMFSAAIIFTIPLAMSLFASGVNGAGLNAKSSMSQDTSGTMTTSKPKTTHHTHKAAPPAESSQAMPEGTNIDLSGTYMGKVNYPDGNMTGPATLTITGNDFTLTPDGGSAVSGKVSAVTTHGYTGVAMQMGAYTTENKAEATLVSISARAKKHGGSLSLTSVPESGHKFSFNTSGKK